MPHENSSVSKAAANALASCGPAAVGVLGEYYRISDAKDGRRAAMAVSYRKACTLVTANDEAAVAYLLKSLVDDRNDDVAKDMANGAAWVLEKIGPSVPSLIPRLIASFSGKPSESPSAPRACAVLQRLGDPAVDQLLKAAVAQDEAVRYWSLVALRPAGHKLHPNVEAQGETLAKLTFEDSSERVAKIAYELFLSLPSEQVSKATLAMVKKHVNSKDPQKQERARTIYRAFQPKGGKQIFIP